jgi:hypothetical protein
MSRPEPELQSRSEESVEGRGRRGFERKLLRYGLLTALLMGLVLVPILVHNINFPKDAAEAILAAIAVAVFLLCRYIGRRKNSS